MPETVAYGDLEVLDDGRWRLRFRRLLTHPVEKVWRAISEPEHLAHWFPTTIEGERRTGAPLRFGFAEDQFPAFDGEMLAFEPPQVMELRWGPDVIRLELRPAGSGTELTLLDTIEEHGKAARDGTGWHTCLDALEAALEGAAEPRAALANWRDLNGAYVERFGPEAATVGPPEGAI